MKKKTEKWARNIFAFLFVVTIFVGCSALFIMHDPDYCLEDGDCYEGRVIKDTDGTEILINEKNCLKYNWKWDKERKMCKIDDESKKTLFFN